jgi:hypothetical protein
VAEGNFQPVLEEVFRDGKVMWNYSSNLVLEEADNHHPVSVSFPSLYSTPPIQFYQREC